MKIIITNSRNNLDTNFWIPDDLDPNVAYLHATFGPTINHFVELSTDGLTQTITREGSEQALANWKADPIRILLNTERERYNSMFGITAVIAVA